jgi:hypothetical protein
MGTKASSQARFFVTMNASIVSTRLKIMAE